MIDAVTSQVLFYRSAPFIVTQHALRPLRDVISALVMGGRQSLHCIPFMLSLLGGLG